MKKIETELPGVYILEPQVFEDKRGFFMESYNQNVMNEIGIDNLFVQDNQSRSCKGTLRGFHYQLKCQQAKLCRVVRGSVLDVAVDIRKGSPTFGKWVKVVLSEENKRQIYIPRGFAHGFAVLSEFADFIYKCDNYYCREDDYGVLWNDSDVGVDWDVEDPIISDKDCGLRPLADIPEDELPEYVGDA